MGEHDVSTSFRSGGPQAYMKALLADLAALEQMIETGLIETGVNRIGAEQEMFLVDSAMRPAPHALEVLREARDSRLTTEIGVFNLEANLTPQFLTGSGLRQMEKELTEVLAIARRAALQCKR